MALSFSQRETLKTLSNTGHMFYKKGNPNNVHAKKGETDAGLSTAVKVNLSIVKSLVKAGMIGLENLKYTPTHHVQAVMLTPEGVSVIVDEIVTDMHDPEGPGLSEIVKA